MTVLVVFTIPTVKLRGWPTVGCYNFQTISINLIIQTQGR